MLDEMIKSGYFMYIAEEEGCIDVINSRAAKVNAIIKDFKYIINTVDNPNDYKKQIFAKYGLTEDSLTEAEVRKINTAIRSRF